jgi:hypothetical protein
MARLLGMSEPLRLATGPVAVPTLPEVLADRALLDPLPRHVLMGMRRQTRYLAACIAAALASRPAPGTGPPEPIEVMEVDEAAKLLHTSADSLYRKRKRLRLGYIDTLDGKLKFTRQEIRDYIRRQQRC